MRFVAVKSEEQQAILAVHRARQGFVKARTGQANQIWGLLAEFGVAIPQGIAQLSRQLPGLVDDEENGLPESLRDLLWRLLERFRELDRQVKELEGEIRAWHRHNEASRRLEAIPGVGPLTASALVATVGDACEFRNARQFAAFLGLVPRANTPAEASPGCWASASAAMCICARC